MTTSRNIQERIKIQGREGAALSNAEVDGLDNEIDNIVLHIRAAKDYIVATSSLNELGTLQELLSLLLFKYGALLSAKQKIVIRGFDRPDDPDLRLVVYKAIMDGRFP